MTVLIEKYNLEVHYNDFLRKTESGKMPTRSHTQKEDLMKKYTC